MAHPPTDPRTVVVTALRADDLLRESVPFEVLGEVTTRDDGPRGCRALYDSPKVLARKAADLGANAVIGYWENPRAHVDAGGVAVLVGDPSQVAVMTRARGVRIVLGGLCLGAIAAGIVALLERRDPGGVPPWYIVLPVGLLITVAFHTAVRGLWWLLCGWGPRRPAIRTPAPRP